MDPFCQGLFSALAPLRALSCTGKSLDALRFDCSAGDRSLRCVRRTNTWEAAAQVTDESRGSLEACLAGIGKVDDYHYWFGFQLDGNHVDCKMGPGQAPDLRGDEPQVTLECSK